VEAGQAEETSGRRCGHCGGPATVDAGQSVVGDRLAWSVSVGCPSCGDAEEECGWDEMPAAARDLLIARVGLVRLRAGAEASRPVRTRLLTVFRRDGATIEAALAGYRALTSDGIVGTPAESRLLAARLTAEGAVVSLDPVTDAG
jgi:hypothetical protein